eukprot:1394154-Rhodomonas_salina.4
MLPEDAKDTQRNSQKEQQPGPPFAFAHARRPIAYLQACPTPNIASSNLSWQQHSARQYQPSSHTQHYTPLQYGIIAYSSTDIAQKERRHIHQPMQSRFLPLAPGTITPRVSTPVGRNQLSQTMRNQPHATTCPAQTGRRQRSRAAGYRCRRTARTLRAHSSLTGSISEIRLNFRSPWSLGSVCAERSLPVLECIGGYGSVPSPVHRCSGYTNQSPVP